VGLIDGADGGQVDIHQLLQQAAAADIKQVHRVQRSAAPACMVAQEGAIIYWSRGV
jgi:hypothetical protein